MTILHKSSHAFRRIALGNRINKKTYSHFSQPLYRASAPGGSTASSESKTAGWLLPAAIAIFGLGFSTFSTHQLMSCSGDNVILSSKTKVFSE